MTHQEIQLMPLFKKFISETKSGKRLKRNGKRIKPETSRREHFKGMGTNKNRFNQKKKIRVS